MRDWRELVRERITGAGLTAGAEADLIEELSQHLEQRYQDLVAAGVQPAAAERAVEAELGSGADIVRAARARRSRRPTPPAVGAERGGNILAGMASDVRVAVRMLLRSRGFALAAVLTLALGIGANTAIFGMIDAVLLRSWPFAEPDELVVVWETDRASNTTHEPASWPDIVDFDERARTLATVAAVSASDLTLRLPDGEPLRVAGVLVTPNFFELLGVRPLIGRGFAPEEGAVGGTGVTVLLGETFWRTRFGADPSVIGTSLAGGNFTATVVGVAPAGADLGMRQVHRRADYGAPFNATRVDVWVSFKPTAASFPRSTHPFLALARLSPGTTVTDAQRELAAIAAELEHDYPENDARGVHVQPLGEAVFGAVRPALLLLLIAVGLVLVVTCANVANLLLARTNARLREVAVRRALGASSARIGRQLLTESVVLTAFGTTCGVAVGWLALRLMVALAPADVPRLADATLDARVLGFTVAIATLVAIVFGGIPAVRLRSAGLRGALQAQPGRVTEGAGGRRLRGALVVGQIALAVTLFTAAGLLLRSYAALLAVDPGFRTAGVLKAEYQLPSARYPAERSQWPNYPAVNTFHVNVVRQVSALPGVQAAGLTARHPLDAGYTNSFVVVGREAESADYPEIRTRFASPGYLAAAGVPLLSGRDITPADDALAPRVGLLNRSAAERYFPGTDPIGQRLRFWGVDWRIVGVIGDERFKGIDQASEPAIYTPLVQAPQSTVALLVRTDGDPESLVPQLRRLFRELDPEIPLFGVEPLEQTLAATIAQPRFTTALLGIFSSVTVILALIGVYGLLAYAVAQRTRELGIRMALGATRREIRRMVLGQAARLAAGGVALGIVLALAGTRLLSSLLFAVTPTDPATFALVTVVVLATAAGAAWLPARRATIVNPVEALRD